MGIRKCVSAALVLAAVLPALHARVQDRIGQRIDDGRTKAVRGNVHPLAQAAYDRGRLSPATLLPRIVLHFNRTAAQQAELDTLLREQQDPASANYHKWLTPEQFAARFGLSEGDLAQVTDWLQGRGFTIVETARSRSYVAFRGSVGQVDSVFRAEIHRYAVDGEEHFANAAEPVVPEAIAGIVQSLHGLDDFRPRAPNTIARPQFTSYISGAHRLAPDDFATIYNVQPLLHAGIDGTGQTIVVIGQSDIDLSDISTFRSVSGLPPMTPQKVLVPSSTNPGILPLDAKETDLDLEWTGAVARGANLVYVFARSAFTAFTYAVDQNLGQVLSSSYGNCEQNLGSSFVNTLASTAQQANAQGMTITAASGDSGAADCDTGTIATQGLAADVMAVIPYVTGVGGSTANDGDGTFGTTFWNAANNILNGSALSYIPEVAWNDGSTGGATGGGASIFFVKPPWQTGIGVPNDGKRDVPDVSLFGSPSQPAYLICAAGSCVNGYRRADDTLNFIGGTSAGAPAFAGIVALLNQYTGSAQGNINPRLYELAALSTDAFHDITSGDNKVSCSGTDCVNGTMGFSAGVGYDQVTGLGSVDAFRLITEWTKVDIRPNPVAFGNRLPNVADTRTVTLRNNSPLLNISGISISGNFSQTNNCPAALSFGASCTIQVSFLPTSLTTQTGTLTISADDSGSPHQIPISGTGADLPITVAGLARAVRAEANGAPVAGFSPPAASAMAQPVTSDRAAPRVVTPPHALRVTPTRLAPGGVVTLFNGRTMAVAIAIDASGDFRQENDCGTELKAGASCSIRVQADGSAAAGELKITTPAGTTRVAIGATER